MSILTPAYVYRRYITDGVPESGEHDPKKAEIVQLLDMLFGVANGAWVVAQTKAALDAVTPDEETWGGVVLNDPTAGNNGYYYRAAGAWVRGRGFPDTAAVLIDVGGTGNAITANTQPGVNPADIQLLILPAAPGTNSVGAVTIALNGGAAQPVKNASGADPAPGDIIEGVGTLFFRFGTEWRQLFSSATGESFDHQGDWDDEVTYTEGQVVTGSNGNWYQLKAPSSLNDDPVGSVTGDWLLILREGTTPDGSITDAKIDPDSMLAGWIDDVLIFRGPDYAWTGSVNAALLQFITDCQGKPFGIIPEGVYTVDGAHLLIEGLSNFRVICSPDAIFDDVARPYVGQNAVSRDLPWGTRFKDCHNSTWERGRWRSIAANLGGTSNGFFDETNYTDRFPILALEGCTGVRLRGIEHEGNPGVGLMMVDMQAVATALGGLTGAAFAYLNLRGAFFNAYNCEDIVDEDHTLVPNTCFREQITYLACKNVQLIRPTSLVTDYFRSGTATGGQTVITLSGGGLPAGNPIVSINGTAQSASTYTLAPDRTSITLNSGMTAGDFYTVGLTNFASMMKILHVDQFTIDNMKVRDHNTTSMFDLIGEEVIVKNSHVDFPYGKFVDITHEWEEGNGPSRNITIRDCSTTGPGLTNVGSAGTEWNDYRIEGLVLDNFTVQVGRSGSNQTANSPNWFVRTPGVRGLEVRNCNIVNTGTFFTPVASGVTWRFRECTIDWSRADSVLASSARGFAVAGTLEFYGCTMNARSTSSGISDVNFVGTGGIDFYGGYVANTVFDVPAGMSLDFFSTALVNVTFTGSGTVRKYGCIVDGRIQTETLSNYADDAAAAAGGVPVGALYRTSSAVKQRVA